MSWELMQTFLLHRKVVTNKSLTTKENCMLKATYEPGDESRFQLDRGVAEKLQETKQVRGIEVNLGMNAYYGTPKRIWYTVRVGTGYHASFGPDYGKAKDFYDRLDWFAELLAAGQEIRKNTITSERDTWRAIAAHAGGHEIEIP
jgi:hypothetical protein